MKIKRFEFNMFPENCYVLWDETNEAVVIDPGCFYEEEKQTLKNFIIKNGLNVKHLLNTHLHLKRFPGHLRKPGESLRGSSAGRSVCREFPQPEGRNPWRPLCPGNMYLRHKRRIASYRKSRDPPMW